MGGGRHDEPIPLADSLREVIAGLHPEPTAARGSRGSDATTLGGVFGRWEEAVGASVAAHVQPVKLDGPLLVVSVDDPAWATQLRFLEATLRQRLSEVAGATIERIEVRVSRGADQAPSRRGDQRNERPTPRGQKPSK